MSKTISQLKGTMSRYMFTNSFTNKNVNGISKYMFLSDLINDEKIIESVGNSINILNEYKPGFINHLNFDYKLTSCGRKLYYFNNNWIILYDKFCENNIKAFLVNKRDQTLIIELMFKDFSEERTIIEVIVKTDNNGLSAINISYDKIFQYYDNFSIDTFINEILCDLKLKQVFGSDSIIGLCGMNEDFIILADDIEPTFIMGKIIPIFIKEMVNMYSECKNIDYGSRHLISDSSKIKINSWPTN